MESLKSETLYLKKPYAVTSLLIITSSFVAIAYYGNSIFINHYRASKFLVETPFKHEEKL